MTTSLENTPEHSVPSELTIWGGLTGTLPRRGWGMVVEEERLSFWVLLLVVDEDEALGCSHCWMKSWEFGVSWRTAGRLLWKRKVTLRPTSPYPFSVDIKLTKIRSYFKKWHKVRLRGRFQFHVKFFSELLSFQSSILGRKTQNALNLMHTNVIVVELWYQKDMMSHQKVFDQSSNILRHVRWASPTRRQLHQSDQKVFTLLYILQRLLSRTQNIIFTKNGTFVQI